MVLSESFSIWKDIEKLKIKEQKSILRWQLQAKEPIHSFSDMKAGDHLVKKSSSLHGKIKLYEHHFICIGSDCDGRPKIIHYYNTPKNAGVQLFPTSRGSGTALEQLGIVQEMTLPHEDFIKSEDELQAKGAEVERVVWPEELKRYSTDEVIEKAQKRVGEKFYHPIENNCESFVMWCLCGLNITLQATPVLEALCETGSAVIRTVWQAIQQLPKVFAELSDDIALQAARVGASVDEATPALSKVGTGIGVALTVAIEAIMAAYDIHKEYKKWKEGVLIKSREQFIAEVADKVILALSRSGGSIAGMIVGQLVIPVPILGGLLGALVGIFGGHLEGKFLSAKTKKALGQLIDTLINRLDEMKADLYAISMISRKTSRNCYSVS